MSTPIDQMNDIECLREIARRCGVSGTQGLNEIGSLRAILAKLSGSAQNETEALRFLTTGSTSGGGGTVNTGNAAVGDVRSSKTFSSSVLTNATGTLVVPVAPTGDAAVGDVLAGKVFSSLNGDNITGTSATNATVSGGAPIQPAQAFVDNIGKISAAFATYDASVDSSVNLDLSHSGITSYDSTLLYTINPNGNATGFWGICRFVPFAVGAHVDLSGNSLSVDSVNAILHAAKLIFTNEGYIPDSYTPISLDLSGQTPAASPTGQGITDKAALILAGWSVQTD